MALFKTKYLFGLAIIGVALSLPLLHINRNSVSSNLVEKTSSTSVESHPISLYISEMKDRYSKQMKSLSTFHGVKVNDLADSKTGQELLFKPKATSKYISFDGKAYRPVLNISTGMVRTILSLSSDASAQGFL